MDSNRGLREDYAGIYIYTYKAVNGAIAADQELNDLYRMKIKCARREEDLPVTEEEEEEEEEDEGLLALQQQLSPATMAEKWKRKVKNNG